MSRVPIRIPSYSKYRNVRSEDKRHVSKRESKRAFDLKILERVGEISELREQVRYELIPAQEGENPVYYVADFVYFDKQGNKVVEDVKGFKTKDYIIKRKLMMFRHGIRVREV